MDGLGQKGETMKSREAKSLLMRVNLQFFADGDGAGTDNSNSGGTGAEGTETGEETGSTGTSGTAGTSEGGREPTFDELLKSGHQAEFERRVQEAVNAALTKAQEKWQALTDDKLSEAEKLSKMTKDEKEKYLQQKHEKELADRESAITRRELTAEAKNTLAEKNLPAELAEILNYTDADSCKASIEAVEKVFQKAVENTVDERLKGGKPPKAAPVAGTVFSKEQVSTMSPEEINKNWDNIQKSMTTW